VRSYDLAIVGSGSAAFAAAITASRLGRTVVMVERGAVGGTCVNVGCVPSKALLAAAQARHDALHPRFPGIHTDAPKPVDFTALIAAERRLVNEMREERYVAVAAEYGWPIVPAQARFGPADNALAGAGRTVDYTNLPSVTFTSPAIASVGRTEAAARTSGFDTDTRLLPLDYVPRALVGRDTRGLVKLVAERGSGRLLGATAVADGGGEVIAAAGYALAAGMTVDQLADAWCPYLTMTEGLRLAAQSFSRDPSTLSCCVA